MYHERQRLQFCALHVLNNLFQEQVFSKEDLDNICYSLNPDATINPHKSLLGLGNYDVNVLTMALQLKGYQFIWFDKRKDLGTLAITNIYGFIINKMSKPKCLGLQIPIKQRHWIAVRSVNGCFYNLDSKLDTPNIIGDCEKLVIFLKSELSVPKTELFLVVSDSAADSRTWTKAADDE